MINFVHSHPLTLYVILCACNIQVVSDNGTKQKILEACHNDAVGGYHFGRDKTAAKVSARYYWKTLSNDEKLLFMTVDSIVVN